MSTIKLAMEIPPATLGLLHLTDLDFVLAHKVLDDNTYAEAFRHRYEKRELILDNSYHELGVPLPLSDLLEAAERCRADYVITPDRVGDTIFNIESYRTARSVLAGYKLAVVMTGTPSSQQTKADWVTYHAERENFLFAVREAEMLCCTFKEPERYTWYDSSPLARRWKRVHLLGVAEAEELAKWKYRAEINPSISFSVDTGKPFKWALRGKLMSELESWRLNAETTTLGQPSEASIKLLETPASEITERVKELCHLNTAELRRYL